MARTSSHFFESSPSFAADSHCFRKNIENVSQSEACADGQIMLLLLLFFIIILDEDEDENEEEEEEEEEEGDHRFDGHGGHARCNHIQGAMVLCIFS